MNMTVEIMVQYDGMFDLKIKVDHTNPHFYSFITQKSNMFILHKCFRVLIL